MASDKKLNCLLSVLYIFGIILQKKKKSFAPHFYGDTPKMTTFFLKAHQISEFEALIELDFFSQGLGSFFFFLKFF